MIPKQITNLIDLALRDGIMTLREKQTIIAEAMAQGLDKDEITAEIDSRLRQLVDTMPKENLKRCKSCGAQIPLISDDCLYCGVQLTQSKAARPIPTSGNLSEAERIIIEENAITNSQNINIKNCPDCGAPYPILSNICPNCGHVLHENVDSEFNIRNLIDSSNKYLDELRNCEVKIIEALVNKSYIYFAELSIVFFIVFFNSSSNFAALLTGGFLFLAGMSYLLNIILGKSPADRADKKYFELKSEYEKLCRHTDSIYGNNPEAVAAIDRLNGKFGQIDANNSKNRRVVQTVTGCLIVLMLIVYLSMNTYNKRYEAVLKEHPKTFELADREKILRHGLYWGGDTFVKDYEHAKYYNEYLIPGDYATMKIVPKTSSPVYLCNDSIFTIKIENLRLESTGKIFPGNPDTLSMKLVLFNRQGKGVSSMEGLIIDETFRNDSIQHPMPDSSRLDFRRLMREGKYSYYANFANYKTYDASQIDTLMKIMDEAESFVILLN